MADVSGPWAAVAWGEAEWHAYMQSALPSGVVGTPQVSVGAGPLAFTTSGLTPSLDVGKAWVGGAWFNRDAAAALAAITPNTHATQSRIDRIVLRKDLGSHTVTPVRIQGTPAATPAIPSMTRTATVWDLLLYRFTVPPASGTVLSNIVDERTWLNDGNLADPDDLAVLGDLTVAGSASGQDPVDPQDFATRAWVEATVPKFKTGSGTVTSSGSTAQVTVTHNLGVVPSFFSVTFRTGGIHSYGYSKVSASTTQFTYKVYYDDAPVNNNTHDIEWLVVA